MYAVILTGGKQYRVKEGELVSVEKLEIEVGRKVAFDRILLIEDDSKIMIGAPEIDGAVVTAEVIENYKDEKVLVFKKKRRKQYRRTNGHRQQLTKVRIDKVWAEGKPAGLPEETFEPKAAPAPKAPKAEEKAATAVAPKAEKAAKPKKAAKAADETGAEVKKAPARKPAAAKKEGKE